MCTCLQKFRSKRGGCLHVNHKVVRGQPCYLIFAAHCFWDRIWFAAMYSRPASSKNCGLFPVYRVAHWKSSEIERVRYQARAYVGSGCETQILMHTQHALYSFISLPCPKNLPSLLCILRWIPKLICFWMPLCLKICTFY